MLSAVHVWSPAGLPLHLSVRANCQGFHQCRCLPRYRLTATEHAGVTPSPAHGDLLPFQGKHADRLTASSEGYWRLTGLCVQTLGSVVENLPHTNMAELLISLVCLAVLVPVKEINIRYRKRLRTPIPVEILTVSQLISFWFTFDLSTGYSTDNGCF